jgi:hypothetical protein
MTEDERAGIEWWNGSTEEQRRYWLRVACSAVPADAWVAYKAAMSQQGPQRAD